MIDPKLPIEPEYTAEDADADKANDILPDDFPIPDMSALMEELYLDDRIAKYEQELMCGLATFNQY